MPEATLESFDIHHLHDWTTAETRALPFTAERIAALAQRSGLRFPDTVLGAATAALRAGKHVILTGPPGTGSPRWPSCSPRGHRKR